MPNLRVCLHTCEHTWRTPHQSRRAKELESCPIFDSTTPALRTHIKDQGLHQNCSAQCAGFTYLTTKARVHRDLCALPSQELYDLYGQKLYDNFRQQLSRQEFLKDLRNRNITHSITLREEDQEDQEEEQQDEVQEQEQEDQEPERIEEEGEPSEEERADSEKISVGDQQHQDPDVADHLPLFPYRERVEALNRRLNVHFIALAKYGLKSSELDERTAFHYTDVYPDEVPNMPSIYRKLKKVLPDHIHHSKHPEEKYIIWTWVRITIFEPYKLRK